MRTLTHDAGTALLRALGASFAAFKGQFRVDELSSRAWASVTFSGARHKVAFTLEGEDASAAAEAFLARIGEAQFELRGHILADVALIAEERAPEGDRASIRIEALTVEDN
jgi:hypothetical protein